MNDYRLPEAVSFNFSFSASWVSFYVGFSILVFASGKRGIKVRLVGEDGREGGLTSTKAWNPTSSLSALTVTVFHPSVSVRVSSGSVDGEEVMICIND